MDNVPNSVRQTQIQNTMRNLAQEFARYAMTSTFARERFREMHSSLLELNLHFEEACNEASSDNPESD